MTVDQLIYSLLGVALVAGFLTLLATRTKDETGAGLLSSYLLAGGSLGTTPVLSLLVSSSFGLNALFYGAWLGYNLGLYALLIHLAWTGSFLLLAKYATKIRSHRSMHHFLGHDFGSATRVVAGLFSLAGMMYFIGWETEIARQTFGGLLASSSLPDVAEPMRAGSIVAAGTVVACLLYTVLGGLKGNAWADQGLNILKTLALICTIIVLGVLALNTETFSLREALFPSWPRLLAFGAFAFVTNVAFNLSWQFVDASSWQSVIAGRQLAPTNARDNLVASGSTIFFVPNLLGTLIGVFLHGANNVTADNIVGQAALLATSAFPWIALIVGLMCIASAMSLLDGMFLACAFTFVVDILFPTKTLDALEKEPVRAESLLLLVRLGLVGVALAGAWGVRWLMRAFGLTVFDFVYVMVITQLSLLGPILVGLIGGRRPRMPMWIPIVVSAGVGFVAAVLGTHGWSSRWVDAAGTLTAAASVAIAIAASTSSLATDRTEATEAGSSL